MWKIIDTTQGNIETTLDQLRDEYPDMVGYDEFGFEVDLESINDYDLSEKIIIWPSESLSENDDGGNAVAYAIKIGE